MKGFRILARLMGRQAGGNVPLLYARAVRRPLLVEPGLGEAVILGYLAAADSNQPAQKRESLLQVEEGLAVIDVAGALLAHDTVGFCGETPASYPAIGRAFEQALEDPAVQTVFIRLDSPGGEADGCFDLADQIYAARGQKKIVAVVDHMAYSAAYAIASACDEVWVSRTGGVGSVGVVTYHVDQTAFNERQGIKVEYIHAGARKIDGTPHLPLSDEARGWMQAEIDRLHGLFVETVARNRGLTEEQVRTTEAGCFFAEGAIAAGLADKIGTFQQALASHSGSFADLDTEEAPAKPEATAESASPVSMHAEIVEVCVAAGMPEMAAGFIKAGISLEEVQAKLDLSGQIQAICTAAGLPEMAAGFIKEGTPLASVSTAVLAAVQAKDEAEIESRIEPPTSTASSRLQSSSIYEQRRKAHQK